MKMVWSMITITLTPKYVVNIVNKDYMFQVNGLNYNSVKMKIRFICKWIFCEKKKQRRKQYKRTVRRYINLCICINHYDFIVILTHSLTHSLPLCKSFKFVFILFKISSFESVQCILYSTVKWIERPCVDWCVN